MSTQDTENGHYHSTDVGVGEETVADSTNFSRAEVSAGSIGADLRTPMKPVRLTVPVHPRVA